MSNMKRQHEDYWGSCWAVALGQHMDAEVRSTRPDEDPPDIDFHIRRCDGTVMTSWGEVTGAYYNSNEAKWLWGAEPGNVGGGYWEPDAVMGVRARDLVERKRKKYRELARRRGRGHSKPITCRRGSTPRPCSSSPNPSQRTPTTNRNRAGYEAGSDTWRIRRSTHYHWAGSCL